MEVITRDGLRLRARHLLPAPSAPAGLGVVLAHGFSGALDKPAVRAIAERLRRWAGVVVFDFRGHGGSGGHSTLGDAEVLDVDAVVAAARALGYRQLVSLGFSMGGSSVLRHAALMGGRTRHPVDAVVAISAASRWYRTETPAMRRLHWAVQTRSGRWTAARLLGTRVDPRGWPQPPTSPDRLVARIAPIPLLLVHGDRDPYLSTDNATDLYAAAGEPRSLWLWDGFGHAETAMDDARTDQVGRFLPRLLAMPRPAQAKEAIRCAQP
ncbi:MAG TPA: alpha/beta fold hydrolase [Mycobacteriales bacterium]|nr:alpha/beta fold hydrolase [Mycobacteriales bacterium]